MSNQPYNLTRIRSGRKIIEILKKNPKKDPSSYEEDDLGHMRKVVSYCKRHLAQEEKAKQDTNSKSYKSLKNCKSVAELLPSSSKDLTLKGLGLILTSCRGSRCAKVVAG